MLETVENAHTESIWTVDHSPNGKLIASSGGYDKTIKTWDAKTLKLKFAIDDAYPSIVYDLCFAPTGPFLLSAGGGDDQTVKVIKIALLEKYYDRKLLVLLAYLRFSEAVNTFDGSEVAKFENAKIPFERVFVEKRCDGFTTTKILTSNRGAGELLQCALIGGGPKGVLGVILSYV